MQELVATRLERERCGETKGIKERWNEHCSLNSAKNLENDSQKLEQYLFGVEEQGGYNW